MSETFEGLRRKLTTAGELRSVVRTMKALAASTVTRFEHCIEALVDYQATVKYALPVLLCETPGPDRRRGKNRRVSEAAIIAFGSDQGLVGQFNEQLAGKFSRDRQLLPKKARLICVGERLSSMLSGFTFASVNVHNLPNTVTAMTPLVNNLISDIGERPFATGEELWILHNWPGGGTTITPQLENLLPLHAYLENNQSGWPRRVIPDRIAGDGDVRGKCLREFLFISLYKACAESIVAENKSRLIAMQRAERNIDDMLGAFQKDMMHIRQDLIDSELFDVIAGYESLLNSSAQSAN